MGERVAVTGIRPTGDLTVGNFAGAIRPLADLQETYGGEVYAFVADLHGLTDQPPEVIRNARYDVVSSFMAGGVNPEKTNLYVQRDIRGPLLAIENLLQGLVTLGRVTRIPTVKDKLEQAGHEESETDLANLGLVNYPVLMAADIVAQGAHDVPVGKDQYAHLEIARELARRFNHQYGAGAEILVVPQPVEATGVSINSLSNPTKKMSKSNPAGAIILNEGPDAAARKIKRAVTGTAGEASPQLENYLLLCEHLGATPEQLAELTKLYEAHRLGKAVLRQFKEGMTEVVRTFLVGFQERYASISDAEVRAVVERGAEAARANAARVLGNMELAMKFI